MRLRAILLILLLSLSLLPTAKADVQLDCSSTLIGIPTSGDVLFANGTLGGVVKGSCLFHNRIKETYGFSLQNPPFNYTAPIGQGDSIASVVIEARWPTSPPIYLTETASFKIIYRWNTTESMALSYDYTKHGWGIFAYWTAVYTAEANNRYICHAGDTILTPELRVAPYGAFIAGPHTFNRTGQNRTDRVYWDFKDDIIDLSSNFIEDAVNLINLFPGDLGSTTCTNGGTGFTGLNFTALTNPITVEMRTTYPGLHDNRITAAFGNQSQMDETIQRAVEVKLANQDQSCDSALDNLAWILKLLGSVGCLLEDFVFNFVLGLFVVFDKMLGLLFQFVGLKPLYDIVAYPLKLGIDLTMTIFQLFFTAGPGYPPGGAYFALIVYSASFGFGLAAITGNLSYGWKIPGYFIYGTTVGFAIAMYWVYWKIPNEVIDMIFRGTEAIPGE